MSRQERVPVQSELDVVTARQSGRVLARELDMSVSDQTMLATAISEVARNIVTYARQGTITVTLVESGGKTGIEVVASDQGPGIADIEQAMQDGFSTGNSLGLGLPGARRLMDEFEIDSDGDGTTVTMRMWVS